MRQQYPYFRLVFSYHDSIRSGNTLLHLIRGGRGICHGDRFLNRICIRPLLDRGRLEGVVLEFVFLALLLAAHLDEDDDDGREHDQEDDGDEDCFEEDFDEAHCESW